MNSNYLIPYMRNAMLSKRECRNLVKCLIHPNLLGLANSPPNKNISINTRRLPDYTTFCFCISTTNNTLHLQRFILYYSQISSLYKQISSFILFKHPKYPLLYKQISLHWSGYQRKLFVNLLSRMYILKMLE